MMLHMKIAISAVAFPCAASIIQSFAPTWVFITLIICGMLTTAIGLTLAKRHAKQQELLWAMEKAFGKPQTQPTWNAENINNLKGGFNR